MTDSAASETSLEETSNEGIPAFKSETGKQEDIPSQTRFSS